MHPVQASVFAPFHFYAEQGLRPVPKLCWHPYSYDSVFVTNELRLRTEVAPCYHSCFFVRKLFATK